MPMMRFLLVTTALLALAGCSSGADSEESAGHDRADRTIMLELGHPICGDCCVSRVKDALSHMQGVELLDMNPGDVAFGVRAESAAITSNMIVDRLHDAGMTNASVSSAPPSELPRKVWVVAK